MAAQLNSLISNAHFPPDHIEGFRFELGITSGTVNYPLSFQVGYSLRYHNATSYRDVLVPLAGTWSNLSVNADPTKINESNFFFYLDFLSDETHVEILNFTVTDTGSNNPDLAVSTTTYQTTGTALYKLLPTPEITPVDGIYDYPPGTAVSLLLKNYADYQSTDEVIVNWDWLTRDDLYAFSPINLPVIGTESYTIVTDLVPAGNLEMSGGSLGEGFKFGPDYYYEMIRPANTATSYLIGSTLHPNGLIENQTSPFLNLYTIQVIRRVGGAIVAWSKAVRPNLEFKTGDIISWVPLPTTSYTRIQFGDATPISVPVSAPAWFDTRLVPPGTLQKVTVNQYDDSDTLLSTSQFIYMVQPASPKKVFLKPGSLAATSVTIKWASFGNILTLLQNVKIFVESDSNITIITKTIDELESKGEYLLEGLTSGKTYGVWLTCVNPTGESQTSNKVTFTTL